jgi:PAS domain S-box-containing protein
MEGIQVRAFEDMVLQHSSDAAMILHPADGVVYASPAFEYVTGIPSVQFLGMQAAEWVHPDDVALVIEQREEAGVHGHAGPVVIRGRHGDGSYHHFEAEWWHLATDHTVIHVRDTGRHHSSMAPTATRTITAVAEGRTTSAHLEWTLADGSVAKLRITRD